MRSSGLAGVGSGMLFSFAAVFVDAFEDFSHVLDLFEERIANVNGTLLRGGKSKAIAWARVDLDDFFAEFIFLLENKAGKISGVFQFGNHHAFDRDVKSFE